MRLPECVVPELRLMAYGLLIVRLMHLRPKFGWYSQFDN